MPKLKLSDVVQPQYLTRGLSELDCYVVSHGGCGTSFFADCIGWRPPGKPPYGSYEWMHIPYLLEGYKGKYVYLFGDLINSIVSQESRQFLWHNSHLMKKEEWIHEYSLVAEKGDHSEFDGDPDPLGIAKQFNNFYYSQSSDVIMMKYPFTERAWYVTMEFLGFDEKYPEMIPRKTKRKRDFMTDSIFSSLQHILDKYQELSTFMDTLPDVIRSK